MVTLSLELKNPNFSQTLLLPAKTVIETRLVVISGQASLPTLISVEKIIDYINNAGFELSSSSEVERISALTNTYYLTTPMSSWQNRKLELDVRQLSLSKSQYDEVKKIRNSVINVADKITPYGISSKEQDKVWTNIAGSKSSDWWTRNKKDVFEFLTKTALGSLIDLLLGINFINFIETIVVL